MPAPSLWYRPIKSRMKRILWLLLAAFLFATTAFSFTSWSRRWDNPVSEKLTLDREIRYSGRTIDVEIQCVCPAAFIQSRSMPVTFNVRLKWREHQVEKLESSEPIDVYADVGGARVEPEGMTIIAYASDLSDDRWTAQSMPLSITPNNSGPSQISFHFVRVSQA